MGPGEASAAVSGTETSWVVTTGRSIETVLLDVFQRRRGNGGHWQALGFGLELSLAGWDLGLWTDGHLCGQACDML